jgi:enterochelin esterase-like enzyme
MLKRVPVALMFSTVLLGQTAPDPAAKPEIELKTFHSSILGRDVTLQVWLPPGYQDRPESKRTYPVIYLLDGGKVFGRPGVDHDKGANLAESLARLTQEGKIPPIIAVGVDECADDADRRDEYLPFRDPVLAPNALEPRGKAFPEFMVAELLPYVSDRYHVTGNPQETAIGGLSYSAIAALYTFIHKPATFQLGFFESPSLQSGNGQLLRDTQQLVLAGRRVAIGIGTMEAGRNADPNINKTAVRLIGALAANLRSAYFPPEVRLTVDEGGTHDASAWARRIPDDLVFLFGAQP